MAEIKIEKKKPVWPWILLTIIIIALLVYFLGYRNKDDDNEIVQNQTITDTVPAKANGPVHEYIQFVNEGQTMGLDHVYTNGALQKLVDAIRTKANEIGYDVTADLDKVKEHSENITKDPFETTHAKSIRSAADILSDAMQNMQQSKFPALQDKMQEVRKAANDIDPNVLTLDQRDAVKNFFNTSAQLLQGMN